MRALKAILQAMAAQAVNLAIAIFLVAIVLGLNAWLDGTPTETDALQASALELQDAIAQARAETAR